MTLDMRLRLSLFDETIAEIQARRRRIAAASLYPIRTCERASSWVSAAMPREAV